MQSTIVMKSLLLVLLFVALAEAKWSKPSFCNNLNCPRFSVVASTPEYEEREYKAATWVSTSVSCMTFRMSSYTMFMRLFRYIGGANDQNTTLAMTAPVLTKVEPLGSQACPYRFTMSFYLPSDRNVELPQPTATTVSVARVGRSTFYVRSFPGFIRALTAWQTQAQSLATDVENDGGSLQTSPYYIAGYNSPWTRENRHNEIWMAKL